MTNKDIKIGQSQQSAQPGEKISVEVDGVSLEVVAGNEISGGKVAIVGGKAFSKSSPRNIQSNKTIKRKRRRRQEQPIQVAIVATVENTDPTLASEVYLYGDRQNALLVDRIELDPTQDFPGGSKELESVVLDSFGLNQWEVFIKIYDFENLLTIPETVFNLLPPGTDPIAGDFLPSATLKLITRETTEIYSEDYAYAINYKGQFGVIDTEDLFSGDGLPLSSNRFRIERETTTLFNWDDLGPIGDEQNVTAYLDREIKLQDENAPEGYRPIAFFDFFNFNFPPTYNFPSSEDFEQGMDSVANGGTFINAVISKNLSNFYFEVYNAFTSFFVGDTIFDVLVEGLPNWIRNVYIDEFYPGNEIRGINPTHFVNVIEDQQIAFSVIAPYFDNFVDYSFRDKLIEAPTSPNQGGNPFVTGRSGIEYFFESTKNFDSQQEIIGFPLFSQANGFEINYVSLAHRILVYSHQSYAQSEERYDLSGFSDYYIGEGEYSFLGNNLEFQLQYNRVNSEFSDASFTVEQENVYINTTVPNLHIKGQTSFIISELVVQKNDDLETISSFEQYFFYLLVDNVWIVTPIVDFSVLATNTSPPKLETPKEFFSLIGRNLYEVVDDDLLQATTSSGSQVNVRQYLIGVDGIIVSQGIRRFPVFPLRRDGVIQSANFYLL